MDKSRKKELLQQYAQKRPEMGVLCFKCIQTGESFLGACNDKRAGFSSVRAKLNMHSHPNKHLMQLWETYGDDGFEISMRDVLEYDNPLDDYSDKLEAMMKKCLSEDADAVRLWR